MMPRWWHVAEEERGASAVLLAVLMPVILGVQALTIDATRMFVERRELQNATDAAAMAAVVYLPTSDPAVLVLARETAVTYAGLNGVQIAGTDVVFSTVVQPNDRVQVRAETDVLFAFARTFGLTSGEVASTSSAQVGQVEGIQGVLPLAVTPPVGGLQMGQAYCLSLRTSGNPNACPNLLRADFDAMDIDDSGSSSANIYRERIASGSLTVVHLGDVRGFSTGNMNTPTRQGFEDRLAGNTDQFSQVVQFVDGRYRVLNWANPHIGLIPMVDNPTSSTARVLGFAVFFIESNPGSGNVVGRFIDAVVPGGTWAPLGSGQNYGGQALRLVQ